MLNKRKYSSALSLSYIHSLSLSLLSVFHRPVGGCKLRMRSTSPHLPNKRLKKGMRERGADGCHRQKESADPRQMACSFTQQSFMPLHLTKSTRCQHLSITVYIKLPNRNSNHQGPWWSMMACNYWNKPSWGYSGHNGTRAVCVCVCEVMHHTSFWGIVLKQSGLQWLYVAVPLMMS